MVMFGGLYLLIPTITIAPPQSTTRTSNANSGNSELELCPPATLDCAAPEISILYTQVKVRVRVRLGPARLGLTPTLNLTLTLSLNPKPKPNPILYTRRTGPRPRPWLWWPRQAGGTRARGSLSS